MIEVKVERSDINYEALNDELHADLRDTTSGISSVNGQITIYLADDATPEQQVQARAIVLAHDPTQLTPEQQARIQHREDLEELRQANTTFLDLSAYKKSEPLRQLAQKVAWLELEFRVSRGE